MIDHLENQHLNIPGLPSLFSDYLFNFKKVAEYYQWNYRTDWQACANSRTEERINRKRVREILEKQNKSWGASERTMQNIQKLESPSTFMVVTGQQAGVLGGPLYTVYKILTVIKLAEWLKSHLDKINIVPCFWIEVNDNDYQEINRLQILNSANEVIRLSLPDQPGDFRSISQRNIPPEIDGIFDQLYELLPPTEFRDETLGQLKTDFSAGVSFTNAFAGWLHKQFGEYGLISLNPADPEFLAMAKPVFETALHSTEELAGKIINVSRKLETSGYHAQIHMEEEKTLLFYRTEDGARCRIDHSGEEFNIRHPSDPYQISADDLLSRLKEQPDRFTPNAALRPVLQDFLLPTIAYVGGPAEISYFAQLKPLYETIGVSQPVFFPRARLTLIEKNIFRLIQKFGFDFPGIFELRAGIIDQFVKRFSDKLLSSEFEAAGEKIASTFGDLKKVMKEIDPTLGAVHEKTQKQVDSAMQKLRYKAEKAFEQKMQTEVRQLNKVVVHLFPEDQFQERILNPVYYTVKYGPDLIDKIYESVIVEDQHHQLLIF